MTKPTREPFAVPSPDRSKPVEINEGMRVVRRPIFQARYNQEGGWGKEMVDRITVAKALGFTAFEIDVTHVKSEVPKEDASEPYGVVRLVFGSIAQPVIEGDEWKGDATKKALRADFVITVYALVVE